MQLGQAAKCQQWGKYFNWNLNCIGIWSGLSSFWLFLNFFTFAACPGGEGAGWGQVARVLARWQPGRVRHQHRGDNVYDDDEDGNGDLPCSLFICSILTFSGSLGFAGLHASRSSWSRQDNCSLVTWFTWNCPWPWILPKNLQCFNWVKSYRATPCLSWYNIMTCGTSGTPRDDLWKYAMSVVHLFFDFSITGFWKCLILYYPSWIC